MIGSIDEGLRWNYYSLKTFPEEKLYIVIGSIDIKCMICFNIISLCVH